jgi:FAD/FMN-containing dehydrogenase
MTAPDLKAPWNFPDDRRPELIVQAADADEIVGAVRQARERGLRVAAQSTGHGAAAVGSLAGTLLIATERMADVVVDPAGRTARAGAGARWSDVTAAVAPHGLAGLHGFSAGVGIAGYVLGGGLGWLARSHGLASDHVRSFEVVTADGERRHVDADREPDLFWALRGGGSAGAIVTSIELELVPLKAAYAGALLWPMARAGEVAHAYREWIRTVPETLTSSLRLMHFPPLPALPEELRGRALVQLTLAFLGERVEGDALIAPLRALAPEIDRVGIVPAAALGEIAGDPVELVPDRNRSRLLASLTAEAVDAVVALADPAVTVVEIRHLGGALRRPAAPSAAGAVDAEALVFATGVPAAPEQARTLDATLAAVAALGPPADRDTLRTFAGPDDVGLTAAAAERVRAIAAGYERGGASVADPAQKP